MAKGAVAVLCGLMFWAASAAKNESTSSTAWLWEFGKSNAGLFPSEVKAPLGAVTVDVLPDSMLLLSATYDDAAGVMRLPYSRNLTSATAIRECKSDVPSGDKWPKRPPGKVYRKECVALYLEDQSRGLPIPGIDIPMTPQRYREIVAVGAQLEIDFSPGIDVQQAVAELQENIWPPRAGMPLHLADTKITVFGRIDAARLLSPDRKTVLAAFRR